MQRTGFNRGTVDKLEMQQAILEAHLDRELQLRRKGIPILSDRSGLDPIVYALTTANNLEERESRRRHLVAVEGFTEALADYQSTENAVVVLLMPVKEWLVDDGVRSLEDGEVCAEEFQMLMKILEIQFHKLGGEMKDLEDRTRFVLDLAVEKSDSI